MRSEVILQKAPSSIFRCVVRNNHLSRISAGKREIKILYRCGRESEVPVIIRCTGHALSGKVFSVHLCPSFLMGIAAALCRKSELELRLLTMAILASRLAPYTRAPFLSRERACLPVAFAQVLIQRWHWIQRPGS